MNVLVFRYVEARKEQHRKELPADWLRNLDRELGKREKVLAKRNAAVDAARREV